MSLCNAKGVSESGAGGISGGISDVSLKRSHAATSVGLSLSSSATSEEVALSTLRRGVSVSSRQACSASFRFTADEPHAAASAKPDEKGRGGGSRSERVTQSASVSGVVPHSVGEMRKRAGERARERARDWERDRANLAMSPTSFGGLASDYSSLYFLRNAGGTGPAPAGAGGGPGGGGAPGGVGRLVKTRTSLNEDDDVRKVEEDMLLAHVRAIALTTPRDRLRFRTSLSAELERTAFEECADVAGAGCGAHEWVAAACRRALTMLRSHEKQLMLHQEAVGCGHRLYAHHLRHEEQEEAADAAMETGHTHTLPQHHAVKSHPPVHALPRNAGDGAIVGTGNRGSGSSDVPVRHGSPLAASRPTAVAASQWQERIEESQHKWSLLWSPRVQGTFVDNVLAEGLKDTAAKRAASRRARPRSSATLTSEDVLNQVE
jgi:hypothetical protein